MRKFINKRNIIILVVVAAIGGWVYAKNRAATAKNLTAIKIYTVTRGEIKDVVTVSGSVTADKRATLNFQTPGKLAYAPVSVGDAVTRGQTILALDTGDLDTAVKAAYYRYLAADANAKAVEDMVKNHDTNEDFNLKNTRVAAQTARDMAYDSWLQAQRDRNKAYLVAPFDGYVTNITVNTVGDTVGLADGITVVDPKGLHYEGEVDETEIGKIKIGQQADVTLDAFPGKTFRGSVSRIWFASRLSSSGATIYPVEIEFAPEDEAELRLGMNGDADIIIGRAENVLMLPIETVVDNTVTLASDSAKQQVVTGIEGKTNVEIKSGLNEGEKVIIK